MTRLLSEFLGAKEPAFRLGLKNLEKAHGMPSADIRLSAEMVQATRDKLKQLGLDPDDTTGPELYHALQQRIKADDIRLERTLRTLAATHVSAEANVMDGIVHALQTLPIEKSCFALKASVLRRLLTKQPPKRTMKQLGYRSQASMIKHETASALLAAAWLIESTAWRRSFVEQYEKLKPHDFETRPIAIISPTSKRWDSLVSKVVAEKRHTVMAFNELGAIILLPLPVNRPEGSVTAAMALALHALNDIRASSTFLKLCQVRGDFGKIVQSVAGNEPMLRAHVLDQLVPWHLVQRYYARAQHLFSEELFEPHIQRDDLTWHSVEQALSHLEPSFNFWHGAAHLGKLYDHQPVSLNLLDAALNYCNRMPYANRIVHYARTQVWQELMLRYLRHETVERTIASELQPQLAMEEVLI